MSPAVYQPSCRDIKHEVCRIDLTVLLGATVHRFGVQSRQPRALPFDLVDYPPCTFVDRKEKRQLRGRRHYIHGSLSLPRSGVRVGTAMDALSAGVRQLPYSDAIVAQQSGDASGSYDIVSWERKEGSRT